MASYDRMNDFIKVENGISMFLPSNANFENSPTVSSQKVTSHKCKCTCVPSGRCHSHTLLGCPHNHYFNDKSVWTCIKDK